MFAFVLRHTFQKVVCHFCAMHSAWVLLSKLETIEFPTFSRLSRPGKRNFNIPDFFPVSQYRGNPESTIFWRCLMLSEHCLLHIKRVLICYYACMSAHLTSAPSMMHVAILKDCHVDPQTQPFNIQKKYLKTYVWGR